MPFDPAAITSAAVSHVMDKYRAEGAVTKCNFFAKDVVEEILQQSRPDLAVNAQGGTARANDQFDNLSRSAEWSSTSLAVDTADKLKQAFDAANDGQLVLVAYRNPNPAASGHIAIVVPALLMDSSGKWGMKVPYIAQAGKPIADFAGESVFASLKLSYGFTPQDIPYMQVFTFNN